MKIKAYDMKRHLILIAAAASLCGAEMTAQTDSRNRTAETIVADGLAQLPAKSPGTFNSVIEELASTGEKGVIQIASRLAPPASGKNAVFEYALGGITDFVTTAKGEKYRGFVRKGLGTAIEQCADPDNKAFLLSQLAKCATKEDMPVFSKYMNDEKLGDAAIRGIISIPGNDTELADLVKSSNLPHLALAKITAERKLTGVEDALLGWTGDSDAKTLKEVYNALATTGTSKSAEVLREAAEKTGYAPDPTFATDAYIKYLENITGDPNTVQKGAKALAGSEIPAVRCAGLNLTLKTAGAAGAKAVLAALKDKDPQYRNTALACGAEYCGEEIFSAVSGKFGKLSAPARIDVMRWIGNNHAKAGEKAVLESVTSADSVLACEAMLAASKIGGDAMLDALIAQVSGAHSEQAAAALLAFNGRINSKITALLNSGEDAGTLVPALNIAGTRHIHEAYGKVAELTGSSDTAVSKAAYAALAGVASPEVYDDICLMLDKSQGGSVEMLQQAACNALAAESADTQFERFSGSMKKSPHPEYYYRLLAQAGTHDAIAAIGEGMARDGSKEAASAAMLRVNSPEALPILLKMAQNAKSGDKSKAIDRYLELAGGTPANAVRKYQMLRAALDLRPSDAQTRKILADMGGTGTVQALAVAAGNLDNAACARAAAEVVRSVISRNGNLNGGGGVRSALQNSIAVFSKDKAAGDADAGYAIDDVNGMLAKTGENGFTLSQNSAVAKAGGESLSYGGRHENFQITADWKGEADATVILRDVPVISLRGNAVEFIGSKKPAAVNAPGEWNTLEIKVVDDRIFVVSNGEEMAGNVPLTEASGAESVPAVGGIRLAVDSGEVQIRDFNICELPSTPVFQLSPEEEKEGFEVLFDGRSLEKWQGNKKNYTPEGGNISVTAAYGGSGNLYTNKKYSDFVFRFDFCFAQPGMNNGIGVRTNIGTDAAYDGMEIQVLDHDDPIYADLAPYQQHGAVYGIIVPKHVKFGEIGTWYSEEIRVVGDRVTVTVDGDVILDGNIREACQGHNVAPDGSDRNPYTADHKNHPGLFNKEGYISFCGHGPGIKFRNVRVLDLSKSKKKRR